MPPEWRAEYWIWTLQEPADFSVWQCDVDGDFPLSAVNVDGGQGVQVEAFEATPTG